jgi:biotin carboxyl carrier protein
VSTIRLIPPGETEAIGVRIEHAIREQAAHCEVSWGNRHVEVEVGCSGPGAGWIRRHGVTFPFYVARHGNTVQLWIRGRVHEFTLPGASVRRSGTAADAGVCDNLAAPMPGTVLQVKVADGDRFEAHQPLVILESMKMEMTLSVPHAGRVEKVHCAEGDLVDMGAVLATLSEADNE